MLHALWEKPARNQKHRAVLSEDHVMSVNRHPKLWSNCSSSNTAGQTYLINKNILKVYQVQTVPQVQAQQPSSKSCLHDLSSCASVLSSDEG